MNERRAPVAFGRQLTLAEYRDDEGQMYCSSSTTSSSSPRPALKVSALLGASHRPWAISRHWPPTWALQVHPRPEGSITFAGDLRPRRLTDPAPATSFAHLRDDGGIAAIARGFTTALSIRWTRRHARSIRASSGGALQSRAKRVFCRLQVVAGHHRHSGHGRVVGRGQAGVAGASSASCRSRSMSPRCSFGFPGKLVPVETRAVSRRLRRRIRSFAQRAFYIVGTIEEPLPAKRSGQTRNQRKTLRMPVKCQSEKLLLSAMSTW